MSTSRAAIPQAVHPPLSAHKAKVEELKREIEKLIYEVDQDIEPTERERASGCCKQAMTERKKKGIRMKIDEHVSELLSLVTAEDDATVKKGNDVRVEEE